MQEIREHDISKFEALGFHSYFVPMNNREEQGHSFVQGVALFSMMPFQKTWALQYGGPKGELPHYGGADPVAKHGSQRFSIAFGEVVKEDTLFRVGTTHFPWTKDGLPTDFQRVDMRKLLSVLAETGECVFTGDFNAPRGDEIFSMLALRYRDNVPSKYTSSIDGTLHKAGPLPYMVDGIFSSPAYEVTDVSMHTGISDHCALVATITSNEVI